VAEKSRAEYYRKRRETRKQFMVLLDKELLERLDRKIRANGMSRAEWLRKKIAEELGE
jgi:metal-responsive CopG/Arc/MetJ family transcriptional regulator